MISQVYSGAKATVLINNEIVAAAFVADYNIETKASEIEALDYIYPFEIAPERIRVNLNLKVYRTPDNDPVLTKMSPGIPDLGIATQAPFMESGYISIEIKDDNDKTILYLPQCWIVRRSGAMSAGEFLIENWSVLSIGYMGPSQ